MSRRAAFLPAVLLAVLLCLPVSCGKKEARELIIGVNLALTGVSAPYGNDTLTGIRLAVAEVNQAGGIHGRRIRTMVLDNASRTDLAAFATQRLEGKKVIALLGPSLSHLTRAALRVLKGTCLLTSGSTAVPLRPAGAKQARLLRLCFTDTVQGIALAEAAARMGCKRAVILFDPALDYSVSLSDSFSAAFTALGGAVLKKLPFTERMIESAPLRLLLESAVPDCVFLPVFYEKGGLFLRQLRQSGCTLPVFSGDGFDNPAFCEIAGEQAHLNGVFFTDHADPKAAEALRPAGQKRLSAYAALGYDAAMTLFEALAALPEAAFTAPEFPSGLLYARLLKTKRTGLTGSYSFSSDGDAIKKPVLICFEQGLPVLAKEQT